MFDVALFCIRLFICVAILALCVISVAAINYAVCLTCVCVLLARFASGLLQINCSRQCFASLCCVSISVDKLFVFAQVQLTCLSFNVRWLV